MEPERVRTQRDLPIDAALLPAVLLRLRRDVGSRIRWSLGDLGQVELDVHFMPVSTPLSSGPVWTSAARAWGRGALAPVPVTIEIAPRDAATCEIVLCTPAELDATGRARTDALATLALAAADELAEELLWHATREDVAQP